MLPLSWPAWRTLIYKKLWVHVYRVLYRTRVVACCLRKFLRTAVLLVLFTVSIFAFTRVVARAPCACPFCSLPRVFSVHCFLFVSLRRPCGCERFVPPVPTMFFAGPRRGCLQLSFFFFFFFVFCCCRRVNVRSLFVL